jgi:hypothetical protein
LIEICAERAVVVLSELQDVNDPLILNTLIEPFGSDPAIFSNDATGENPTSCQP